ncbi:MAG: serine/threonine-protein kinase [Lysobacterales bacterium]
MTAVNAARLMALFDAAVDLPTAEQEALLLRECADDPALLDELRALLAEDRRVQGTTVRPLAPELAGLLAESSEAPSLSGTRVGPYELREELGRGGMGVVYRADRVDGSVQQQVAIKLVRRELLDSDMRRRFQLERQTLAAMDHPHIARLIDAAELDDGTPYYVMEYVDGVPITDYCARQQLSIRERIALFRLVCDAVTQAHRNLIVHRDLKPGNILVSTDGAPKLLDFGIAKLMVPNAAELAAEQTATQHRYFSPQYAAPEQVLGAPIGVGCDVYALGLLLFELLANARAFDFVDLSAGQIERLITSVPPPPPSQIAASKGASTKWQRELRGDLDGIVLRCLRKAANERYASVEQLDADLGNYLQGLPVSARGGQLWYRTRKFVARNAIAVATGSLAILALLIGIIAFAWQAGISEKRLAEVEKIAGFHLAMLRQIEPSVVGETLVANLKQSLERSLIESVVPDADRKKRLKEFAEELAEINATDMARNLIDQSWLGPATKSVTAQFQEQPLVDAELNQVLFETYIRLGLFKPALNCLLRSLSLRERMLGEDHAKTLNSRSWLGHWYFMQRRYVESEAIQRDTLQRLRRALGNDHPFTISAVNNLGSTLLNTRKLDEAEGLLREAWVTSGRILGEENPETIAAAARLGNLLLERGETVAAEPVLSKALSLRRRVLGDQDPATRISLNNFASVLRLQGKYAAAEPLFRELLAISRSALGNEHLDTASAALNYGRVLHELGRTDEGVALQREALAITNRIGGEDHPDTLWIKTNLGFTLQEAGQVGEAQALYLEALSSGRRALGDDHPETLAAIQNLASLRIEQHRYAEARNLLVPAEDGTRRAFSGSNSMARFLLYLGVARARLGEFAVAEANLMEASRLFANLVDTDRIEKMCQRSIGELYETWYQQDPSANVAVKLKAWRKTATANGAGTSFSN